MYRPGSAPPILSFSEHAPPVEDFIDPQQNEEDERYASYEYYVFWAQNRHNPRLHTPSVDWRRQYEHDQRQNKHTIVDQYDSPQHRIMYPLRNQQVYPAPSFDDNLMVPNSNAMRGTKPSDDTVVDKIQKDFPRTPSPPIDVRRANQQAQPKPISPPTVIQRRGIARDAPEFIPAAHQAQQQQQPLMMTPERISDYGTPNGVNPQQHVIPHFPLSPPRQHSDGSVVGAYPQVVSPMITPYGMHQMPLSPEQHMQTDNSPPHFIPNYQQSVEEIRNRLRQTHISEQQYMDPNLVYDPNISPTRNNMHAVLGESPMGMFTPHMPPVMTPQQMPMTPQMMPDSMYSIGEPYMLDPRMVPLNSQPQYMPEYVNYDMNNGQQDMLLNPYSNNLPQHQVGISSLASPDDNSLVDETWKNNDQTQNGHDNNHDGYNNNNSNNNNNNHQSNGRRNNRKNNQHDNRNNRNDNNRNNNNNNNNNNNRGNRRRRNRNNNNNNNNKNNNDRQNNRQNNNNNRMNQSNGQNTGGDDDFDARGLIRGNISLQDLIQQELIIKLACDQNGSRFIQTCLETATPEEKQAVFEQIYPETLRLCTDVFGNYVIQKFFEYGHETHKIKFASSLRGRVLPLSLSMYGCRVVQKALECVNEQLRVVLIEELKGNVEQCVRDQNGNHVIQKCIEEVPDRYLGFICSTFENKVFEFSTHPYGCRVIQRLLEHCTEHEDGRNQRNRRRDASIFLPFQRAILQEIMDHVLHLAKDQYGNYVIQHVLAHGPREARLHIVDNVQGHVLPLSKHKFASNVVEKSFVHARNDEQREALLAEIMGTLENSPLVTMVRDQYANYVIQKVLEVISANQRNRLVKRITDVVPNLRKFIYGKHIVNKIEQLTGKSVR